MDSCKLKHISLAVLVALVAFFLPSLAGAQQVTYYTFDNVSPSNLSSYGYGCLDPAYSEANNPLLCFNNGSGQSGDSPTLTTESCGDGDTRCPYTDDSSHTAIELTPAMGSQRASVWFSIPQKVTNGFTSYFAFRITPGTPPAGYAPATADGIAFVVQNAARCTGEGCGENGSGPNVVGGGGGSIGYGGIDNSLATEFDTFENTENSDPNNDLKTPPNPNNLPYYVGPPANHIAVQSCGTGANSPVHLAPLSGGCLVGGSSGLNNQLPVTLADGHIHEVVIEYSGENGSPANLLQIYIDPAFVPGTHTPDPTAVPVISLTYDIGNSETGGLALLDTNCPYGDCSGPFDSGYVGFTAGTGGSYETQTILSWTFTPHTPVTQQQPINNNGSSTTFPFGDHTYAVTYPSGDAGTSTDMIVDANTISPLDFSALIAGTPFNGSVCQIYQGTGGNCIIYSVHCVDHTSQAKVPCPSTSDPVIAVKTAYESDTTATPVSPGFLQGDPLYSQIASIQGSGTTATVTCTGECSVTDGEVVSIRNNSATDLNAENVTVLGGSTIDTFSYTLPSSASDSGTGGFVTSGNVQNICNGPDDPVPCWQPQRIDGTTSGKTKNFSDLVALFETAVATTTSISAPGIPYGTSAEITVSVSPNTGSGPVTGSVTLTVDGNPLSPQTLSGGSTTFIVTGLGAGPHSLSASYAGEGTFMASSAAGTVTVTLSPVAEVTPPSIDFGTVYVLSITTKKVTITNVGDAPMTITEPFISIVGGGNSKEFVAVNLCPKSLAAGKHCTITVSFVAGPVYTPRTAVLSISDNAPDSPQTVPLTATVINPLAELSTRSLNFGSRKVGTPSEVKTVTLTNPGATSLTINSITITGGQAADFSPPATTCGSSLTAGNSCTVGVTFTPSAKGSRSATLTIKDNARTGTQSVALSGKGT